VRYLLGDVARKLLLVALLAQKSVLMLKSPFLYRVGQQLAVRGQLLAVWIRKLPELMVGRVLRSLVWRFLLATRWQPDLLVQASQFVIAVGQQLVVNL
jgi:hypothetical protein